MCGITGVYNLDKKPVSAGLLKVMTDVIAHRGPDGEGVFIDENIGLGHRRLAILDVNPRSNQPMPSKNNDWVIVFNGCIYNFQKLKLDLRAKGHEFHTTSDTEVIAEGLASEGVSFVEKMNGMFAIAAYQKSTKTMYLCRDRYGVKPLYYWFNGQTLIFGSEIKSILKHPAVKVELDLESLNEYFTFQNLFKYNTFFKSIKMVPPANTLKIDLKTTQIVHNSWWDFNFNDADESMTFEESKEETKRLMEQAVTNQMVSDVPVGSYLSGGMDSGSMTSLASRHVKRLTTFTCGFDMSEVLGYEANYDERRDAEMMANFFKTEHYEQVMNAGDIRWSLPRLVYHLEDPKVGMSYPNYYISRLASKFVKVCLQGTGGDELFGGYPWRYYRVFRSLNRNEFFDQYYDFWQRLVPQDEKKILFQDKVLSKVDLDQPRKSFEGVFTFNDKLRYDTPEAHINNSLYFEIKTFLPGLLLVGDKLSMANGLEERFPFLDNDLVDFAQKIPVRYKLGNLENMLKINENDYRDKRKMYTEFDDGKNILRKAMLDFLPEKIINRKKQGFSAPDESWYRGENAAYVKELLLDKDTVSKEFLNPAYVKKIISEHIDQKINHRLLIWSFMNFEWWCRIFLNNETIE